jgi:outer membrane protein assembly factor BamB
VSRTRGGRRFVVAPHVKGKKRMIRQMFVLLLWVVWCLPAVAQERWPQFRGPGARGVSSDSGLPTTWSTTENVAWVADVPGLGWSSPVVWGDTVYVTTVVSSEAIEEPQGGLYRGRETWSPSGAEHRWMAYALDVDTGAVRWESELHRGTPAQGYHMKNSLASETPVTNGDSVFVYFGNLGVFALDTTDGQVRWSHDVAPSATRLEWGTAASPVLHEDRLYVVNDNDGQSYLVALSAETGNEVWRTERDEGTNWSTPFIWENEQRTEIVTTGTDRVRSYDLEGNQLWELTGMSSITIPTPFAEFGLLYLSSGYLGDQARPVFAIRPGATGDISLRASETDNAFIAWSQPQAAPYNPSQLVYGDALYTLLDRGFFTAHDARTGQEIYPQQRIQVGAAFTASPWAYNDKVFALSEDGDTYVMRAGESFEVLGRNALDEFTMATPAIAHGSLFIRTRSKLYRISEGAAP